VREEPEFGGAGIWAHGGNQDQGARQQQAEVGGGVGGWDTLGGEVGKKEREKEEGKLRRTTHGQGSRIFIWEEIDKKNPANVSTRTRSIIQNILKLHNKNNTSIVSPFSYTRSS
jgi:hypothetical protein